jgi:hypothetical protein
VLRSVVELDVLFLRKILPRSESESLGFVLVIVAEADDHTSVARLS